MPKYIKNKLHRFKQLNTFNWELMISKGPLDIKPGSAVNIYRPDIGTRSYLIASGVQEPWLRIIIPYNDPWVQYFKTIKTNDTIRVLPEVEHKISNLFTLNKEDVIICQESGISAYLSYLSTFISEEIYPTLVYNFKGDGVNLDWIKGRQNVIGGDDIDQLIDHMPKNAKRYFIISNNYILNKVKKVLPKTAELIHAKIN